jgi:hypothetical protein
MLKPNSGHPMRNHEATGSDLHQILGIWTIARLSRFWRCIQVLVSLKKHECGSTEGATSSARNVAPWTALLLKSSTCSVPMTKSLRKPARCPLLIDDCGSC